MNIMQKINLLEDNLVQYFSAYKTINMKNFQLIDPFHSSLLAQVVISCDNVPAFSLSTYKNYFAAASVRSRRTQFIIPRSSPSARICTSTNASPLSCQHGPAVKLIHNSLSSTFYKNPSAQQI